MNSQSQKTLRRIEQNDATMITLWIGSNGGFSSNRSSDFSQLGVAIGRNTHVRVLGVVLDHTVLKVTDRRKIYEGLKSNTSINELRIECYNQSIIGGVVDEILKAYQENNSHLTRLQIEHADLRNGGDRLVATTLNSCTNLKQISIRNSNMSDKQLLPIVQALTGHSSLEKLSLYGNRIGNCMYGGCEALVTLLEDPNCNIHTINLGENHIGNVGTTALINSLANNTTLRNFYLQGNPVGSRFNERMRMMKGVTKILCNESSINNIYASNHTVESVQIGGTHFTTTPHLVGALLNLNKERNKSHVAIKKILKYHPNIDMGPFFEWNTEGEGERDLKALPYVIAWFERAQEAVADDERGEESYNIGERKLSAMYQFAKAMPLMFVPASHNIKRK